jgi:hypothetical protein
LNKTGTRLFFDLEARRFSLPQKPELGTSIPLRLPEDLGALASDPGLFAPTSCKSSASEKFCNLLFLLATHHSPLITAWCKKAFCSTLLEGLPNKDNTADSQ